MGQEESRLVDESVSPVTLTERSIESVAEYIQSADVHKIVCMVGAGISTSAGIPDFRSPDTGLYANLARLNLPFPEAVFDISFFREDPLPFFTLAHELYPGRYKPTWSHCLIRLLSEKGLLLKVFTQNIDCLERTVGIPPEKIIEAHGSFAGQHCIECHSAYPDEKMRDAVGKCTVPYCETPNCNGLVKPDIVFFGEPLPTQFRENIDLLRQADLCIVMGTSLSVQPFASLPDFASDETPRVLLNRNRVGTLGSRPDDVLLLDDCDKTARRFAQVLGWETELCKIRAASGSDIEDHKSESPKIRPTDKNLEETIEHLTDEIDKSLKISRAHEEKLRAHLDPKGPSGSVSDDSKI